MPIARRTARSTSSNRVGGRAPPSDCLDVLLVQGRNLLALEHGGLRETALAAPQPNVRRCLQEPRRARNHDDVRRQVISTSGEMTSTGRSLSRRARYKRPRRRPPAFAGVVNARLAVGGSRERRRTRPAVPRLTALAKVPHPRCVPPPGGSGNRPRSHPRFPAPRSRLPPYGATSRPLRSGVSRRRSASRSTSATRSAERVRLTLSFAVIIPYIRPSTLRRRRQ